MGVVIATPDPDKDSGYCISNKLLSKAMGTNCLAQYNSATIAKAMLVKRDVENAIKEELFMFFLLASCFGIFLHVEYSCTCLLLCPFAKLSVYMSVCT